MNLTPHIAPRWSAHRTIGTTAASFGKNSMERVDVTLEEYNGIDLLNLSVTRDSSGQHSLKRMRGTARYINLQLKAAITADRVSEGGRSNSPSGRACLKHQP